MISFTDVTMFYFIISLPCVCVCRVGCVPASIMERINCNLPIWAQDCSRNLQLPAERSPWLSKQLLSLLVPPIATAATILGRPKGIAIPISSLGLKQPPIVIEIKIGRLHHRQPPIHLRPRSLRRRQRKGLTVPRLSQHILQIRIAILLLTPRTDPARLHCIGKAIDANLEITLTGEDIVPTLIAHDLLITSNYRARRPIRPRHLRMDAVGLGDLIHVVCTSHIVEATGEEGAGDVLLLSTGGDVRVHLVHRLVVRGQGDVDMVIGEVGGREIAIEIVAGGAPVSAGVGAAGEGYGRRGRRGGLADVAHVNGGIRGLTLLGLPNASKKIGRHDLSSSLNLCC